MCVARSGGTELPRAGVREMLVRAGRAVVDRGVAGRGVEEEPMAVPDVAGAAAVGPDVLAAAVDASPDGVALLDEQGRCVYVNAAGCALLGAPPAELVRTGGPMAGPRRRLRRSAVPTPAAPRTSPCASRRSGTAVPS